MVKRARAKLEYSPLMTAFCDPELTVGELRQVYEAVWDTLLDPGNFHREVTGAPEKPQSGGGRAAQLFRAGPAVLLNPPITRG